MLRHVHRQTTTKTFQPANNQIRDVVSKKQPLESWTNWDFGYFFQPVRDDNLADVSATPHERKCSCNIVEAKRFDRADRSNLAITKELKDTLQESIDISEAKSVWANVNDLLMDHGVSYLPVGEINSPERTVPIKRLHGKSMSVNNVLLSNLYHHTTISRIRTAVLLSEN